MNSLKVVAVLSILCTVLLSACAQKQNPASITIKRDNYGTPHIFANDNYGLFYGYGYSLAQDRLYQLEILRHSTQGTVAEILGSDYAEFDKTQRSLFWPADIKQQIEHLDQPNKDVFAGFAAGLNRTIEIVLNDQDSLLPLEFSSNDFKPAPWTDYDVVMLFVGTMLLRYGDFNTELDNQMLLADLVKKHGEQIGQTIFNAVIPTDNAFAPTSIPLEDWPIEHNGAATQANDLPFESAASNWLPSDAGHGFSNALVLGPGKLKGAKAVLVNGPQFGWFVPSYTYSIGFHTPDWEAVGNAPLGYPLPMFGYNRHISWGSTWGASDNVDIFRESLNPENQNSYKYNGEWRQLQTREEIVRVKNGEDIALQVQRSVHGSIIHLDKKNGYAYAKMRGWTGRELTTLVGWMEASKARDYAGWLEAVGKSALNVNWYFADKDGNIAYTSAGAYPIRAYGHDNRLPVSGDGDMDWAGVHPPSWNPHVLNPSSGYIANWNNKPRAGFANPDEWWYSWSEADRIKVLDDAVAQAGSMTPQNAWDLMMRASYQDPNARFFLPLMLSAIAASEKPEHADVYAVLKTWDGRFRDTKGQGTAASDNNRYTHPGNAIFRAWLAQMMNQVLSDDLVGSIGSIIASDTAYGTPDKPTTAGLNISVGSKLLYEVLKERLEYDFLNGVDANRLWLSSLDKTVTAFQGHYGEQVSDWQLAVPATRFKHKNFLGVPQTLASQQRDNIQAMNRGTQNNMTVFGVSKAPIGFEIAAPGQSGYISPQGEMALHYSDQYPLFESHLKKSTWIDLKDIDQNMENETTLQFDR